MFTLMRTSVFNQLYAYWERKCLHRKGHLLTIFMFKESCNSPKEIIESFMTMKTKIKMTRASCICLCCCWCFFFFLEEIPAVVLLIFKFLEGTLIRELEEGFVYVSWRKTISKNCFGCLLVLLRAKEDLT